MSWIEYPDGSVLRKRVPATSEMLLTAHTDDDSPVTEVSWSAGGAELGVSSGPTTRLDLRLALGDKTTRSTRLYVACKRERLPTVYFFKDLTLVRATTEDEQRYAAPATPPEQRYSCRIPYAELERITPNEARRRAASGGADLTGTLIEGGVRFDHPGSITAQDFVIEARGRSDFLLAGVGGGKGYFDFTHVTISGLERDADGEPVTAWDVDRVVLLGGSTLRACELSWGNDTVMLGSNGKLLDSWCHSHTDFINSKGVRQHPDSVQMQQGGGQVVSGCLLDGRIPGDPGCPVVTVRSATAQTFMINNDNTKIQGRVEFTDNVLI